MIVFDFYREFAVWIALALAVLIIIGIFKHGFLSRPVVYHITVLFSIFLMNNAVLVISGNTNVMSYLIASHIINILSLVIYIRGHIFPICFDLEEKYSGYKPLYAAKRLIFTGVLGVCLYTLLAACVFCYALFLENDYEHAENYAGLIIFVTFIFCILMAALAGLLITNGCIRYILTTDKTKGKKVLYIILMFIPIFNFVYGVICLKRISKKV